MHRTHGVGRCRESTELLWKMKIVEMHVVVLQYDDLDQCIDIKGNNRNELIQQS